MALCYVPADHFVAAVKNEEIDSSQNTTSQTEVYEVVGLREENVKHFDMGDGTFQAVAFGGPVHTLDAEGLWQDIDNTLLLTAADGDEAYSNERVSFAPSLSADETILTIQENDYKISMELLSGTQLENHISATDHAVLAVDAVITNSPMARTAQTAETVEELIEMRSTSTVLYENILPNTDLEYILTYKDVKENIIVKAPSESYSYLFSLNLEGLEAQLQEDGSVTITDSISGEEQYIIPAPYMYDANGVFSNAVAYDLLYLKEKYYLSVTADEQWINAEERSFPVTIDPSINTTSTVYDSYISSASPSTNFGTSTAMWVSDGDSTSRHGESMVFVMIPNLPDLPTNATVTSTYLHMYYGYYTQDTTTGYVQVGAYRITDPWTESGVNWTSRQIYDNYGVSTQILGTANAVAGTANQYVPGNLSIPLGDLGQTWYSGYYNYGIALKHIGGPNMSVMFRSAETSYQPYIAFNYGVNTDHYVFTNYYDSTMINHSNYLNYINKAVEIVDLAYSPQFGISFSTTGIPSYKRSLTDACSLGANTPCSDACSVHHKDIYWISNQLYSESRAEREIKVFWTDHESETFCNHFDGLCLPDDVYARVVANRPVIHIMNLIAEDKTPEQYEAFAGITLLHETAHALGLDENYDDPKHSPDGYQCVMEPYLDDDSLSAFYNEILDRKPAFCSNCASELFTALNRNAY